MNIEMSGKVSSILAHKKASTVWSTGPNAMVIDAIRLMDEKNVGALPVVDHGTLVGIVSERDYRIRKARLCPLQLRRLSGQQPHRGHGFKDQC